jgi:prepilin-type N-terminal cleavage/methylation domain-containing protein
VRNRADRAPRSDASKSDASKCDAPKSDAQKSDGGFTLVELLIVIVLTGILMPVIGSVFGAIVKNSPSAQTRADDSRTTRGLTTWLPQDVLSTPPKLVTGSTLGDPGYNVDVARASDCPGALGSNVVQMVWQENAGTLMTYVANYRYVPSPGNTIQIKRYTCSRAGTTGGFSNIRVNNVTTPIIQTSSASATAFNSPVAPYPVQFIDVKVQTVSGVQVLIRAASRNPAKQLP